MAKLLGIDPAPNNGTAAAIEGIIANEAPTKAQPILGWVLGVLGVVIALAIAALVGFKLYKAKKFPKTGSSTTMRYSNR